MIFDCFPFFNELELLEIRLNLLAPVVDAFVIVESELTYSGNKKPLHAKLHREMFSPRMDIPPVYLFEATKEMESHSNAWQMEYAQRNYIKDALVSLQVNGSDIIMVSDADEIMKPEVVKTLPDILKTHRYVRAMHNFHYYYLNGYIGELGSTGICRWEDFTTAQDVRTRWEGTKAIEDAGWHWSYLGGVERIQHKINSWSHQELNNNRFNNPEHIQNALESGKDLFDRTTGPRINYRPITEEHYPEYIVKNQDKYAELIK